MAQYYWEADGGDVGGAPSNMTYSQPWDTTNPWTTVEVATYSKHADFDYCLKLAIASPPESSRRLLDISAVNGNSISDAATVEIYAVLDVDSQYTQVGVGGRTDGSEGSETGIVSRAQLNSEDTDVIEYDGGSFTQLESNVPGVSYDTPMAVRLQMDGTAVKYRIWEYGTGEPGTWDSETSSTGVTSSGGVGLYNFSVYGDIYLVAFGVGTGGDSAPTEPVSGDENNVTPSTGSITQTGLTPATEHTVQAVIGALSETGMAPTVTTEGIAEALPGIGALYESGLAPTLVIDNTIAPETGVINTEGLSPEVGQLIPTSEPQIGVISVSGNVVTIGLVADLTPEPGRMRVTGLTQSAGLFTPVYPAVGSLAMVGYNPQVDTRIWVTDGEAPDGWTQDGAGPDGWSADAAAGTSWTPS